MCQNTLLLDQKFQAFEFKELKSLFNFLTNLLINLELSKYSISNFFLKFINSFLSERFSHLQINQIPSYSRNIYFFPDLMDFET